MHGAVHGLLPNVWSLRCDAGRYFVSSHLFLEMNIAIIGYGKMGQAIEKIAEKRGHTIVLRITSANAQDMTTTALQKADVAIEFTGPDAARANVQQCFQAGVSVVCGTTGWNEQLHQAKKQAKESNVAFLQASNFSIGVNIFFEINKLLATLMNQVSGYDVMIEETHHTQKRCTQRDRHYARRTNNRPAAKQKKMGAK